MEGNGLKIFDVLIYHFIFLNWGLVLRLSFKKFPLHSKDHWNNFKKKQVIIMSKQIKWYADQYYHVFNRGHNHDLIFFNSNHYHYFLQKFSSYLLDYVDVIAYVLIPNHFHFLVKIKSIEKVCTHYFEKYPGRKNDEKIDIIHKIVGNAFAAFFNSFTKSINNQRNQTGSLFQGNCKRKIIENDEYLQSVVAYIHYNPIKHGLVKISDSIITQEDMFTKYKYSSYKAVKYDAQTHIRKDILLDLFDGIDGFKVFHKNYNVEKIERLIDDYIFED